jgi:hypothetical protein
MQPEPEAVARPQLLVLDEELGLGHSIPEPEPEELPVEGGAEGAVPTTPRGEPTKKKSSWLRRRKQKAADDAEADADAAAADSGQEPQDQESRVEKLAGITVSGGIDDGTDPGFFAHSHHNLLKRRTASKGNAKLRKVFRREHPFYRVNFRDSDQPCVGVAAKKFFRVNPVFAAHVEWAVRVALASLLAALPAMLTYFRQEVNWEVCHDTLFECEGWAGKDRGSKESQCLKNPNFMMQVCPFSCDRDGCRQELAFTPGENWVPEFDRSYAAVVCVLAMGITAGETHRFVWEVFAGVATAAIIPQLCDIWIGSGPVATATFIAVLSMAFLVMPIDATTKKFGLGLCVRYLCVRSYWDYQEWFWDNGWTTYHVAKMGVYGALCALLLQLLPFPRTSRGEAHRCLNSATSDILIALGFLVQSFTDGQTLQERTKAIRYADHIAGELMALEQYLNFAWWEPGSEHTVSKYKVCLATLHELRANLHGMQQALQHWDNEPNRKMIQKRRTNLMRLSRATMETLDGVVLFMTEGGAEDNTGENLASYEQGGWNAVRTVTVRSRLETQIKSRINGYAGLQQQMRAFQIMYSDMRASCEEERKDASDEDRLEHDEWMHLFLGSLTAFGQALLDFPDSYAKTHEARLNERKMAEFIPEAKLIVLYFQKRYFIASLKTAVAVTAAFLVNVAYYDYDSLAPVIVAYVMSGHYGGSYTNTASRCLGVLGGMIVSFMVIIVSNCDAATLGIGYAVVIGVFGYIRLSSASQSYAALVASVVASQLMVHECSTDRDAQYRQVRQCLLACAVMAVAEVCVYPTTSLFFLRKQICGTLTEMRVVFVEVFQSHLADCWSNIERKAYIANMYAKGTVEEYTPVSREKRVVDNSLWRNLPLYINSQEALVGQAWAEPSFWRPPFPITAYDRLVELNRQSVMFLTILQNHLARASRMRGEQRQLLDEARTELTSVKVSLLEAIDELATSIRCNTVEEEAVDVRAVPCDRADMPTLTPCHACVEQSWLDSASTGQRKSYALAGGRQTLTGMSFSACAWQG